MDREHVGLFHRARIDALLRLDRGECGETVAVQRRALEFEIVRRLLHFASEFLLHQTRAAGEEVIRFAHQFSVAGEIDLAGARTRAALDLIQQARPCPAFEERVGAGAHQKRSLQCRNGAVDRADRGERPEIAAGPGLRAAMLEDLRRPVIAGDEDVRKRLVVAQLHVEARTKLH